MAAILSITQLPFFGAVEKDHRAILYCDDTTPNDGARDVAEAFNDRKVFMYDTSSDDSLVARIRDYVGSDPENRLTLFVHNLATLAVMDTLEELDAPTRERLSVYTLGGKTMIPNALANKVCNYVLDLFAVSSDDPILIERVRVVANEVGRPSEEPIARTAFFDLHRELHPSNKEGPADRGERFRKIFEQKQVDALLSDPFYIERMEHYRRNFTDFTINILEYEAPHYAGKAAVADPKPPVKHSGLLLGGLPYSLHEDGMIESYSEAFAELAAEDI